MQELVLDLHLHSRFSRAVSPRMKIPNMYLWGRKKGVNILSVADFTHPIWFREAQSQLEEVNDGIYQFKFADKTHAENPEFFQQDFIGPYFMLSCEVAAIYTENGRGHRIHNLIFAPNFETGAKINEALHTHGVNLSSDGRPTLGKINTRQLLELLYGIDPKIALIPCHIWTPWFSLYGSRSGYDRLSDCFGKFSGRVFAVETGLSSDPRMNWRIKELSTRSIVSFSDAHSLEKMGREATVIKLKNKNKKFKISKSDITYSNILNSFVRGRERVFEIAYTIEFYPEEGKYHFTGHRNCGVSYSPTDDKALGVICPTCGRELTVGVMHRVEELANFHENNFTYEKDEHETVWVKDPSGVHPPYVSLVPLLEILAEDQSSGVSSQAVVALFNLLVSRLRSEHDVLLRAPLDKIQEIAGESVTASIKRARAREVKIVPGYDGEYGKVSIGKENAEDTRSAIKQTGLF